MKIIYKFLVLVLIYILIENLTQYILQTDKLFYSFLSEQYSINQIEKILNFQKKWEWLYYIFIPIFLLIKIILVSSVLYIGTFFYSKIKITFKQLFEVVIMAEFIFLLIGVSKIIWFHFFQKIYTLEDLQYFYPLSALNIVGYKGLEQYFTYPFQVLNLFELSYILFLAYHIGELTYNTKEKSKPMDFGLKIVASSYIPALLLWVALVMFFTLNNT